MQVLCVIFERIHNKGGQYFYHKTSDRSQGVGVAGVDSFCLRLGLFLRYGVCHFNSLYFVR